jgi:D-3-phosphoglycerate dehydrogenase
VPKNIRIVVCESAGFAPAATAALTRLGEVIWRDCDRVSLLQSVADADVLWVRLRHVIDEEVMQAAPKLRWIASPTTGLNHIDLQAAASRGIRVVSLRGQVQFLANVRATAELTLALMLALLRHIPDAIEHAREGGWNRDLFRGSELHRRTVGIVGFGRLGRIVSRYLVALGARVLATDVRPVEAEPGVKFLSLAELLEQSDIVSLHVDFTPENYEFFNRNCFERMKAGSYFVNTARGELIDEIPLLEALGSGRLAGAALDVTTEEWGADRAHHRLVAYARQHPNLLLTPHIGGCTAESMSQAETFLAELFTCALADAEAGSESASANLCALGKP